MKKSELFPTGLPEDSVVREYDDSCKWYRIDTI